MQYSTTKKIYYEACFIKYKNDMWKTWKTISVEQKRKNKS